MEYVRFSEYNLDRKETWHFYFPVKDNMKTLKFLSEDICVGKSSWVGDINYDKLFTFDVKLRFNEKEVDDLVESCQKEIGGLVKSHTKLHGVCHLEEEFAKYKKEELEKYTIWNLTTRYCFWANLYEEWKQNRATVYAKLTFPNSKQYLHHF